jgi:hypothetical protein
VQLPEVPSMATLARALAASALPLAYSEYEGSTWALQDDAARQQDAKLLERQCVQVSAGRGGGGGGGSTMC